MRNLMKQISRPVALAVTATAGVLMALTAAPSAVADTGSPAPECVEYFQSWRYTDVNNGCADTVSVTVEYTNGQWAPCRTIEAGGWATFAGYGTNGNYVTGLRTCDPALATISGA
ncbi:alpha-amylase [Streptomyces parvus]|uniref:alpha-amylase n=1 Tax=Streptomyces TaxID=1883 RepID=UPI001587334F|nr:MULTISPECIES: alpha-amylase [unclassified Streptomyces]NUV68196.1 alpha-amylase [Streptomyces sp. CAI-121]NUW02573.1 alpha-amylase [Streptomyces sp. CAI 127]NUW14094.1 alpha-amylase [Streptomyces sp. CAI-68]